MFTYIRNLFKLKIFSGSLRIQLERIYFFSVLLLFCFYLQRLKIVFKINQRTIKIFLAHLSSSHDTAQRLKISALQLKSLVDGYPDRNFTNWVKMGPGWDTNPEHFGFNRQCSSNWAIWTTSEQNNPPRHPYGSEIWSFIWNSWWTVWTDFNKLWMRNFIFFFKHLLIFAYAFSLTWKDCSNDLFTKFAKMAVLKQKLQQ